MRKLILLTVTFFFLITGFLVADEQVLGLWKTIDDETGQKKSIIVLYEKSNVLYGKILATFDEEGNLFDTINAPEKLADKIPGEPFVCGLDIVWGLTDNGKIWTLGKIMDPAKPKIYDCDIAYDKRKGQLMVKGKIGIFFRKQFWEKASLNDLPSDFIMPEIDSLEPNITEL